MWSKKKSYQPKKFRARTTNLDASSERARREAADLSRKLESERKAKQTEERDKKNYKKNWKKLNENK